MAKLSVFFLIIFLAVLSLLAFFNKDSVSVTVWKGITYEDIPVIALIFMSTAVGIISMLLIAVVRDARRGLNSWQIQRKHKKEARILDSYSKGLEAFLCRRYDEAAELFTEVLDHDPAHLNSLLRLGDISFKNREFNKAEEFYLKAREVKPKNIEALLYLEKMAETQNKWTEAVKYLDNILDIDSDNIHILKKKGDVYRETGKWEDLLDVQHKILKCKLSPEQEKEENEKLLGYKYELGRFHIEAGPVDKAIKMLKGVVKADRNFTAAYLSLADAHIKDGNHKEAQAVLLKGYEETASMVFLVRLEDHFINEGEPGTIIDIYQKAVQKDQKNSKLQFFLAKLYYRLEMIDHAFDTINVIDTTSFDYPELHSLLGSIYERRSDHEKAADEFKKALNDKHLRVPYCCSKCSHISDQWSGRCPECGRWNTFILDINEICKIQKR